MFFIIILVFFSKTTAEVIAGMWGSSYLFKDAINTPLTTLFSTIFSRIFSSDFADFKKCSWVEVIYNVALSSAVKAAEVKSINYIYIKDWIRFFVNLLEWAIQASKSRITHHRIIFLVFFSKLQYFFLSTSFTCHTDFEQLDLVFVCKKGTYMYYYHFTFFLEEGKV